MYYLDEFNTGDQCGPLAFDTVLDMQPMRLGAGQSARFEAPDRSAFSVIDADLPEGWSIRIARASAMSGISEMTWPGIPADIGSTAASGRGPDRLIRVDMPERAGDYVVQLTAPLARDRWTWAGGFYLWLVHVE